MRIRIQKNAILHGTQSVIGIISPKNTLPILSNILIETEKNNIKLTTTDLDIGIITTTTSEIIEEGGITIPARRFIDILKELPDKDIDIYTKKNNTIIIETGDLIFKLLGVPKEEFPKIPTFTEKEQLVLEQAALKKALNMTTFATSHDETRYVLNGVCLIITKDNITMVATDGRRLAIFNQPNKTGFSVDKKIIIPTKATQELQRSLKDKGEARIMFSKNQAMLKIDELIIISRLIEGEFPNYEQVIPGEAKNKIGVNREQLTSAIRRASLLITPESQAIKVHVQKNKLTISKVTPEIGEVREDVAAEYDGEEFAVGFNPNYLLDVLKNMEEERLELELTGPEKPGVIRAGGGYIYIVLPMQIA